MNDALKELITAYEAYIDLLEAAESALLPMAHIRGFRSSQESVKRGEELRDTIARLKPIALNAA